MIELRISDAAWLAAADAYALRASKFDGQPWFTADVSAALTGAVRASIIASTPLVVAGELEQLASQFDSDSCTAEDRVSDHLDSGNQTGASIAVVTSEIYEAAAEHLRERAQELRGES